MSAKPRVSVVAITYNQEKFVRQALDGFVNQSTIFDIEVLIGDDHSSDTTPDILREYAKQYPTLIKPILRNKNLGSMYNFVDTLQHASGEYIALCEGDDYWTDDNKLQSQVDFLDSHVDHAMCFHKVGILFEGEPAAKTIFPSVAGGAQFTVKDLLQENFIQTNSVLYRRQDYKDIPKDIIPGDWYMHLYHAKTGKIGFIDEVMSVYRRHIGGMWWEASSGNNDGVWKKYGLEHLRLFVRIGELFNNESKYQNIISEHTTQAYEAIIRTDMLYNQNKLKQAIIEFPDATEAFIMESIAQREKALIDLKKHADEQAKIIEYYKDESVKLEAENVSLRNILATPLPKRIARKIAATIKHR